MQRHIHKDLAVHWPEEQKHSLGERLKVVVPVDLCVVHHGDFPKHLKDGVSSTDGKSSCTVQD